MVYKHGINDMPYGWASENEYNKRIYRTWKSMLRRCYSKTYKEKCPTYKNCYVCERWLKLSKFIEDISKIEGYELWLNNPDKRIALDKDIKKEGNKCYCLEYCMFTTPYDNNRKMLETRDNEKFKGENNGMFNKHHSDNAKKKMSDKRKGENNPRAKKVAQYDLDGNLIRIWDYAKQVADEFGWNNRTFTCHLDGRYSSEYNGFIWKYHKE